MSIKGKAVLLSYGNTFDNEMGDHREYLDKAPLNEPLEIEEIDSEGWVRFKKFSYIYHPKDIKYI